MTVSAHMVWEQHTRCTVGTVVPGVAYAVVVGTASYSHTATGLSTPASVAQALVVLIGLPASYVGAGVFDIALPPEEVSATNVAVAPLDVGTTATLKRALRIQTAALDDMLRVWLETATALADQYLQQDYDSLSDIERPVQLGVFQVVRVFKESFDQFEGLTASRNQDRSEAYADAAQGDRARRAGEALWYPYAVHPDVVRLPR